MQVLGSTRPFRLNLCDGVWIVWAERGQGHLQNKGEVSDNGRTYGPKWLDWPQTSQGILGHLLHWRSLLRSFDESRWTLASGGGSWWARGGLAAR